MVNSSSSCFFCGGPVERKRTRSSLSNHERVGLMRVDANNIEAFNLWEERCVLSTCRILGIQSNHQAVGALLETKMYYCNVCVQLMRDMDFTVRAMDKLQRNIRRFRRILLEKLEWKAETTEKMTKEPSNSNDNAQFDLFSFVYERAQEVSKQDDGSLPLLLVDSSKPVSELTSEQASSLESTEIKEEIIVEDCLDYEEFSFSGIEPENRHSDSEDDKGREAEFDFSIRTRSKTSKTEKPKTDETNSVKSDGDNFDADFSFNIENEGESQQVNSEEDSKQTSKEDDTNSDKDFSISSGEDEPGDHSRSSSDYDPDEDDDEDWYVTPEVDKKRSTPTRKTLNTAEETKERKKRKPNMPCNISCHYTNCEVKVKTFNALDAHIKKLHLDEKMPFFVCDICNKTFVYNANLKMHKTYVHNKGPKTYYKRPNSKSNAKKAILPKETSPCSFCGVSYVKEELEEHENQHRSREFPFSCLICDNVNLPHLTALSQHMKNTHPDSHMNQCHHCGKWYKNAPTLQQHINRSHGGSQFRCSYCPNIYKFETSLKNHMKDCFRAPHNLNKNICEICGKICKDSHLLKCHMLVHQDERPFKCRVCGEGFKRRYNMITHEQIHAGLKFPCPDCPMVFTTARYLQQHSRRHLPRVLKRYRKDKKPSEVPQGFCPDGDKCTKRHSLIHTGFPFKCDTCPKTFKTSYYLKQHVETHLPEELRTLQRGIRKHKKTLEQTPSKDESKEEDQDSSSSSSSEASEVEEMEEESQNQEGNDLVSVITE